MFRHAIEREFFELEAKRNAATYLDTTNTMTDLSDGVGGTVTQNPGELWIDTLCNAPSSFAMRTENLNHAGTDLIAWTEDLFCSFWRNRQYHRIGLKVGSNLFASTGAYVGFGAGQLLATGGAGATVNQNHIGLRWNLTAGVWEFVVNDQNGAVGQRQFIKTFPDGALGSHTWGLGILFQLELFYFPRRGVKIGLSGGRSPMITDADFSPATPFLNLYNNGNATNATRKGINFYATTGAGGGGQSQGFFVAPYRVIRATPIGDI